MAKWFIGLPCYYCGAPSTSRDHVIPRHDQPVEGKILIKFVDLVPACNKCNSYKQHLSIEGFRGWRRGGFCLCDAGTAKPAFAPLGLGGAALLVFPWLAPWEKVYRPLWGLEGGRNQLQQHGPAFKIADATKQAFAPRAV